MKKIDEEKYSCFNRDLPFLELHFGKEIAYFPQTPQLDYIVKPGETLKNSVRQAMAKESQKTFDTLEEIDQYIESQIEEKGSYHVYDVAFRDNDQDAMYEIAEYSGYLISPYKSKICGYELGDI